MTSLRDMLTLKPVRVEVDGMVVMLSRPTLVDLVEAVQAAERGPVEARCFTLHRHAHDEAGVPIFDSIEHAGRCPAHVAAPLVVAIERLYNEGRD
jgi:hypothetical protein